MSVRKRVSLLGRRADITKSAFDEHWSGPHTEVVLRLPGIRRYVQHHVVAGEVGDVDGVVEMWFDADVGSSDAHFSSEQEADELRFIGTLTGLAIAETELVEPSAGVWIVGRGDGAAAAASIADALARPARVQSRLVDEPVMRRAALATLDPAPDACIHVACGLDEVAEVAAAVARVDLEGFETIAIVGTKPEQKA